MVHLLFSANRWEKVRELRASLDAGTHVFVDRYAFSGVAFSAAKPGLSLEWCKGPDKGLPQPDLVCFLDVSADEVSLLRKVRVRTVFFTNHSLAISQKKIKEHQVKELQNSIIHFLKQL